MRKNEYRKLPLISAPPPTHLQVPLTLLSPLECCPLPSVYKPTSVNIPYEVVYAHGFMSGSLRFEIRNEVKTDSFPVPTVGAVHKVAMGTSGKKIKGRETRLKITF